MKAALPGRRAARASIAGLVVGALLLGGAIGFSAIGGPGAVANAAETSGGPVVSLGGQVLRDDAGKATVEARVEVAPGYHINAADPDEKYLVPTALTLSVPGATFSNPEYPEAKVQKFAFAGDKPMRVYSGGFTIRARASEASDGPVRATLHYQACNDERCLPPVTISAMLHDAAASADRPGSESASAGREAASDGAGAEAPRADEGEGGGFLGAEGADWLPRWLASAGLLPALGMTFLLGLMLNLTPCVYPLVSVTIGYFGGQAQARPLPLALAYVLGITVTFAVLGVTAALAGGLFGAPLQHPAVLIAIAGVLVALACSSFGFYEIRAPRFLLDRFGQSSTGLGGALLMGLTMGLIAAPCIGPVVLGLLVYVGSTRDAVRGFLLFFTLGLGMGLPYVALALAAGSLRRLPRAGLWLGWMNRLFGFLLLGMALYFVSPLLSEGFLRVAFPALVAAAGVVLGFLPLGEGESGRFKTGRRIAGLIAMAAAIWLALPARQPLGQVHWEPLTIAALDSAIDARRPTVIEFAADWCLPCLEMKRTTFTDPGVAKMAQRFSMLQADVTESNRVNDALLSRFEVAGVPTLIFFDVHGEEVERLVGYVNADKLGDVMERVLGSKAAI